MKTYCSQRCADRLDHGEHRATSGRLITCDICVEDKPLTDYIHSIKEHGTAPRQWNLPVPSGCLPHIAPELVDLQSGVCTGCLRAHILTQFETRGAVNISCVQTHAAAPTRNYTRRDMLATSTASTHNWLPYAHGFLSADRHDAFYEQLFDLYLHTSATLWDCPSKCGYTAGVLQPNDTPGFPHVECPGCHDRFCANCKVGWHNDQTCQQYHAAHAEVLDEGEATHLHEMARLGARRCPRCQFVIIKDGGCDHMFCEQCHLDFTWSLAEPVVAPSASHELSSDSSIQEWAHIHHDPSIFFLDLRTNDWARGPCELEALATQQAGKRFIRQRSHDRKHLWAFIQVDGTHEDGASLPEILEGLHGNLRFGDTLPEITDRRVVVTVANEGPPVDADALFAGVRAISSGLAGVLRMLRRPGLLGAALVEGSGAEDVDDDTDDESDSLEGASADGDADLAAANALFEAEVDEVARFQRFMDLQEEARWERIRTRDMEDHGDEVSAARAGTPAEDLDARVASLQESVATLLGDVARLGRGEHGDRLLEVPEREQHNNNTLDLE